MSKVFNLYTKDSDGNDIDRTWYQSSNIKYSECVDHDNELKTLRVYSIMRHNMYTKT